MAAKSFIRLVSGKLRAIQATVVSLGAANDGDIVALDTTGKLDPSVLPVGVGPDVKILEATEDVAVGDYVNIFDDTGTPKVRLADNSNGREAHGFIPTGGNATTGNNATVYFEGPNPNLSGLLAGQRAYLGVAGNFITTPLVPITDTGKIHQLLGTAIDATTVNTDIDDCVVL